MSIFNKRLRQTTDNRNDDFFSDETPKGNYTGIYAAFFEREESAKASINFLEQDWQPDAMELQSYPNAFNGSGFGGYFVRFTAVNKPIEDIRAYIASLA